MGSSSPPNTKHANILAAVDSIELAAKATTNKAEATGKLAALAGKIDKYIADQVFFRIRPDQQDLAILVLLDKLVRDMEAAHDAQTHGPIEGSGGTRPSQLTGQYLGRAASRWLPLYRKF